MNCIHEPKIATAPNGARLCKSCADAGELEALKSGDHFLAYLGDGGRTITTWTGALLGKVTQHTRHKRPGNWVSGEAWFVRVTDVHGGRWYGQGPGPGCYVKLRRAKP